MWLLACIRGAHLNRHKCFPHPQHAQVDGYGLQSGFLGARALLGHTSRLVVRCRQNGYTVAMSTCDGGNVASILCNM